MTLKTKKPRILLLLLPFICLFSGCQSGALNLREPETIPLLQTWQGDYPVARLKRLPRGQRMSRTGYIGSPLDFARVWKAFEPSKHVPPVDFKENLVVFSRNVTFYNHKAIVKALLRQGTVEILARETMSAMPIEENVAMAMALIPRAGVEAIAVGQGKHLVEPYDPGAVSDPVNTFYTIEGQDICLINGHAEKRVAQDSATRIRTWVTGNVVHGDLDGDGHPDAALLLVHDLGGSGTFYYVAVAENLHGQYLGTHAVLLGDRISPGDLQVQNSLVGVRFAKRRAHEPMSTAPSVDVFLRLTLDEGRLKILKPIEEGEQILGGVVVVGHEVRSFHPCAGSTDYWLSGASPALSEIMVRHEKTLVDSGPYTPLFMVLAGRFVDAPPEGYGAEYAGVFLATQLVSVRPGVSCPIP